MERFYKPLFLNSHSIMLIIDAQTGGIYDANNAAADFYGWTRSELKKKNIKEINTLPAEDIDRELKEIITRDKSTYVFKHRLKDGRVKTIQTYTGPIEMDNKKLLYSIIHDISGSIAQAEALRESEEKFRTIYEYMPVGVAQVGLDFRIRAANKAYCRMLGYKESELIDKHLSEITQPESLDENIKQQKHLASGKIDFYRMEKKFIHKNGSIVYGALTACLIRDSKGLPSYFLGVVVDVSQLHILEARLAQARKMESIGCMAGGIAHDFNNILNIIIGNAELAMYSGSDPDQLEESLDAILTAGQRAASLTSKLLDFARKQPSLPVDIDFDEAVKKTIVSLRNTLGQGVAIDFKSNLVNKVSLSMDPVQLSRIITSLCINAADFMEKKGRIRINTESTVLKQDFFDSLNELPMPGDYVSLKVSDTGPGISPEILPRIFDPFFTTRDVGKGTGLGLSSVFGLVKQNRGYITVDSTPGKGTEFIIYFPVSQ